MIPFNRPEDSDAGQRLGLPNGRQMEIGHGASTYTLEDWSELVSKYDGYLAHRLGLGNAEIDPLNEPPRRETATLLQTIANLNTTIADLKLQLEELGSGD